MRCQRAAWVVLLGTFAAFLRSPQLLGQWRHAHPLHTYVPPHVPLQRLHFVPGPPVHFRPDFGYHYGPHGFPYFAGHPWFVLHVSVPIVREPIVIREHAPARKRERAPFLIDFWVLALKDGPIYAVTDYWLEEDTLHYVERDGTKSAAPLKDVDLRLTKLVNRKLGRPFRLPRSARHTHGVDEESREGPARSPGESR